MCRLFDEWKNEIKRYCEQNNLSFEKAETLSQAWNESTVVLYYCDLEQGKNGLLNDIPSPMVLLIKKEKNGSLTFEKTEFTDKFLKKVS